jgi:hypothetical protein
MTYLLLLSLTVTALAQDFVFDKDKGRAVPAFAGQLKLMRGKVFKTTPEGTTPVSAGERFRKSDVIVTAEKSFAKVQLVDDTIVTVGASSELKLDEFDFMDKGNRKIVVTLIKGQLTGDVKNKAKPGDVIFKSRYSSMGIRGTYILMNHRVNGSLYVADYALLSGEAAVTDHAQGTTTLGRGDRLTLVYNESQTKTARKEEKLAPDEFAALEARGIDEDAQIRPFLSFSSLEGLGIDSTAPEDKTTASPGKDSPREERDGNWQENLKKLNEKLREQNRRR